MCLLALKLKTLPTKYCLLFAKFTSYWLHRITQNDFTQWKCVQKLVGAYILSCQFVIFTLYKSPGTCCMRICSVNENFKRHFCIFTTKFRSSINTEDLQQDFYLCVVMFCVNMIKKSCIYLYKIYMYMKHKKDDMVILVTIVSTSLVFFAVY